MKARTLAVLTLSACIPLACAPAATGDSQPAPNTITSEDMRATDAQTVYEAVERLEPDWLSTRGPQSMTNPTPMVAAVYIDGVEMGDTQYLRNVNVADVAKVRYWGPGEAGVRFGMGHQRGVIELTLAGS